MLAKVSTSMYMESRKMVLMNYFQGSNGDTREQTCGHSAGKRVEQIEREDWKRTLPYVKWIVSGNLLYDAIFFYFLALLMYT